MSPSDVVLCLFRALIVQCTTSTSDAGSLALITAQTGLAQASRHYTFLMTEKAGLSTSMTLHPRTPHSSTRTSTSLMTRRHPTRPPLTLTVCSTTPQVLPPRGKGAACHQLPGLRSWRPMGPPQYTGL